MDIERFIEEWILVSNSYDTDQYLEFFTATAVLDDPSVGRKFTGKQGIKAYFVNYFIGYKTQTRQVSLVVKDGRRAHLEVEFSGNFPEGRIGGTFDFEFIDGKIAFVSADLIS